MCDPEGSGELQGGADMSVDYDAGRSAGTLKAGWVGTLLGNLTQTSLLDLPSQYAVKEDPEVSL